MIVKSIMDNFLLSDFANSITSEASDFIHNAGVLKDLPFDALVFTKLEKAGFDKFVEDSPDDNIFPTLEELSAQILSGDKKFY